MGQQSEITRILVQAGKRDGSAPALQATALVNEAYLTLVDQRRVKGRTHFVAVAAQAMRRILVDHASRRSRACSVCRSARRRAMALCSRVAAALA